LEGKYFREIGGKVISAKVTKAKEIWTVRSRRRHDKDQCGSREIFLRENEE
jgi:hypothetical protein